MINNFKETVEKLNIFQELEFNYVKKNKDNKSYLDYKSLNHVYSLLFPKGNTIYLKCLACGNENSFYVHQSQYYYLSENSDEKKLSEIPIAIYPTGLGSMNIHLNRLLDENIYYSKLYEGVYYFDYIFRCSHNKSHIQLMKIKVTFKDEKIKLVKISQDPINISLTKNNSQVFSKQLKMFDALDDYKDALACQSRNLFAGATTYLRRIYEKMINYYITESKIVLEDRRIETKVKSIKEFLSPEFLDVSSSLYALLSKSIHELNNDEISSYYIYLNGAIEFQLAFQKNKDELNEEMLLIKKSLSEATGKFKNKEEQL